MTRLEILERDREALAKLHSSTNYFDHSTYNALVHAIWRIDREIKELTDTEQD